MRVPSQFSPAREWEPLGLFGTRRRDPICDCLCGQASQALWPSFAGGLFSAWSTKTGDSIHWRRPRCALAIKHQIYPLLSNAHQLGCCAYTRVPRLRVSEQSGRFCALCPEPRLLLQLLGTVMGTGIQDEPQPGPSTRQRQRRGLLPPEVMELLVPPVKVGAWSGMSATVSSKAKSNDSRWCRCLGRRWRRHRPGHQPLCQRSIVRRPVVYAGDQLLVYVSAPVCTLSHG